jgi:hypothetical protein
VVSGDVPPGHPGSSINRRGCTLNHTLLVVLMEVHTLALIVAALLAEERTVGLGAGADVGLLDVNFCHQRRSATRPYGLPRSGWRRRRPWRPSIPETALLARVTLRPAAVGAAVVLEGLANYIAALLAIGLHHAVAFHLVVGQGSGATY